jgi:6-pyruvoyltetrahydropterin/6-carboxytetrahydropterin synthase
MHGHRYRWEAVIEGDVVQKSGVSEEGMLMDFSDISKILETYIHDIVDHSFIVYENDLLGIEALEVLGDEHRTLKVPFIPTAENLAKWAFEQVEPHIVSKYGQGMLEKLLNHGHPGQRTKNYQRLFLPKSQDCLRNIRMPY